MAIRVSLRLITGVMWPNGYPISSYILGYPIWEGLGPLHQGLGRSGGVQMAPKGVQMGSKWGSGWGSGDPNPVFFLILVPEKLAAPLLGPLLAPKVREGEVERTH